MADAVCFNGAPWGAASERKKCAFAMAKQGGWVTGLRIEPVLIGVVVGDAQLVDIARVQIWFYLGWFWISTSNQHYAMHRRKRCV